MEEVISGTAPNGTTLRQITCTPLDGGRVSVWIHSPDADNGWEINVTVAELQAALARISQRSAAAQVSDGLV